MDRDDLAKRLTDMLGIGGARKADSFLDGFLGGRSGSQQEELLERLSEMLDKQKPQKAPEKGVRWHRQVIDAKTYVPLSDVIELLRVNDVLPAVRRGLEKLE